MLYSNVRIICHTRPQSFFIFECFSIYSLDHMHILGMDYCHVDNHISSLKAYFLVYFKKRDH
jgi:hypothetical protein